jgi:GTPase SAR1 family protein
MIRFAILGNSGAGKTTFARRLGHDHQIQPIDLDTVYWEPDSSGVARPLKVSGQILMKMLRDRDSWIIEGCYEDLIGEVLLLEPTLLFVDPGSSSAERTAWSGNGSHTSTRRNGIRTNRSLFSWSGWRITTRALD